ncbi:FAD:protein FMN transferase [Gilliamella sp. B2969]|uniref:FAD:protein FMN transferase n=1 Tax=Gilliamella sp. B2969 TaxID=2818021 RepID=UPI002269AE16|nr:FAD:protein FMN transferase [Gilliamella sp. B2969]MCX8729121.1 FAD:protein FMN transferase [Gilliamella sp. B2969]
MVNSSYESYEYVQNLLGTTVSLILCEPNENVAHKIFELIKVLESKLTVNRPVSEVMSVNLAAGQQPVKVSHSIFSLIAQAKDVSLMPGSCFNIAIGPLVKLWKIGFNGRFPPSQQQIDEKRLLIDPQDIELNVEDQTVFLKKKGMEIDMGAIAKGYIADIVKAILLQNGINQAIINLGGNVVALNQSPANAEGFWHIGLRKPFSNNDELVGFLKVINKSVVTSGIYERYFVHKDTLYHHILDSSTGYPLNNELESITIISDTSLEGDLFSTLLYGLGYERANEYLQKHRNLSAIFLLKNKTIKLANPHNFAFELTNHQYVMP